MRIHLLIFINTKEPIINFLFIENTLVFSIIYVIPSLYHCTFVCGFFSCVNFYDFNLIYMNSILPLIWVERWVVLFFGIWQRGCWIERWINIYPLNVHENNLKWAKYRDDMKFGQLTYQIDQLTSHSRIGKFCVKKKPIN